MPPRRFSYDLFVSYSRRDQDLVQPLVKLLRLKGRVFFDLDSIQPGEQWESSLRRGIATTKQVLVCWCCHAERSNMVATEMSLAIELGTSMVPLLLCQTPMPEALRAFQAIDYAARGHGCAATCAAQTGQSRANDVYRSRWSGSPAESHDVARVCAAIEKGLEEFD